MRVQSPNDRGLRDSTSARIFVTLGTNMALSVKRHCSRHSEMLRAIPHRFPDLYLALQALSVTRSCRKLCAPRIHPPSMDPQFLFPCKPHPILIEKNERPTSCKICLRNPPKQIFTSLYRYGNGLSCPNPMILMKRIQKHLKAAKMSWAKLTAAFPNPSFR